MPMPTTDEHSNASLHTGSAIGAPVRAVPLIHRFGASDSVGWAGTVLPLTACAAIWGIGDSSSAEVVWLMIVRGVIGTAASAWTVLQLTLRWRAPRTSRMPVISLPRPTLLAIYTLLVLQPMLAIASSMLHGDHATLFGIPLPSVLPADQRAALQVDRLHGGNALLLLALIALHVWSALRRAAGREKPRTFGM